VFKQENRLKTDKDIKTLFARGRSVFDIDVSFRYLKNKLPVSRFSVVVGTKVSKNAVDRNKIKRKIRGIIEKHMKEMNPGLDVMVLVKKSALAKSSQELQSQLENLLKRAKLL